MTVAIASSTAARNAGSWIVARLLCTTTISVCGVGLETGLLQDLVGTVSLADVRIRLVDLLRPDRAADNDGDDTRAIQPKTAVFQCLALQRPIRAAMLFDLFNGDMAAVLC